MEAHVAPVPSQASAEPPPPDAPRDTTSMFPAGPGVTLMTDQFQALLRDPRIRDLKVPFEARVEIAEKLLGKGEPIHDGTHEGFVWRGISARTVSAPFGCSEYIVSSKGPASAMRPADHKACGLPYSADPTKSFSGPAPKRTAFRLEEVLAEAGPLTPSAAVGHARMKLGVAESHENGEEQWAGIAGRGKSAPITCRVLSLGGAKPRVEDAPLEKCGLQWPMPGMTFEAGPEVAPIDKDAKLAECANTCAATEVCMVDQRVPFNASLRLESDGLRARYTDGRAAKAELVTSCVPLPSTCSTAQSSCFFPPPAPGQPYAWNPGPCPKDGNTGHAFLSVPSNHLVCYSRIGGPPISRPSNPILVPPPPGPKTTAKPNAPPPVF